MGNPRVNPLNPLLGKIEKFEQSNKAALQYESTRVEWTLKRLNYDQARKQLYSQGTPGEYTFAEFGQIVSDFPMELFCDPRKGCIPIHRDQKATHPQWFKSFKKLPFVEGYLNKLSSTRTDPNKPLGMVFPRKGFAQGLLLHNGSHEDFVPPRGSCHLYKLDDGLHLVVQPYQTFVDQIKNSI